MTEPISPRPPSAKEALIIELLGHVGELHDAVTALPAELQIAIKTAYQEAFGELATETEKKKRELIRFNAQHQSGFTWKTALFIALAAAVGAIAGTSGYSYYLGHTRADYEELGIAAARVWRELPESVRGQIQAARSR